LLGCAFVKRYTTIGFGRPLKPWWALVAGLVIFGGLFVDQYARSRPIHPARLSHGLEALNLPKKGLQVQVMLPK
jgi:hypothetical protein